MAVRTIARTKLIRTNFLRDVFIVTLSIGVAVALARTDAPRYLWQITEGIAYVAEFLIGLLYISVFTVAPASVVLAELSRQRPLWEVTLFGGLGAMVGDYVIFYFVRQRVRPNLLQALPRRYAKRLSAQLRSKYLRWLLAIAGALIVASPFPDELGLALMGFSQLRTTWFLCLSFVLNAAGIGVLALIVRQLV